MYSLTFQLSSTPYSSWIRTMLAELLFTQNQLMELEILTAMLMKI